MQNSSALRADVGSFAPTFTTATFGMSTREWLRRGQALEQLLDQGYAELDINPDFLEHHAPRIYAGLAGPLGIAQNPFAKCFRTTRRRDDELGEDMESGLMERRDDEHKNQFHYHVDIEAWLREQKAPVEDYRAFFDSCDALDRAGWEIACEIGRSFDRLFVGATLEQEFRHGLRISRILDYLRFLPGLAAAPDRPQAKPHYDRGTLTPHWESTASGLVVYGRDGKPHRMQETDRGKLLLFWGRKFGLMYEKQTGIVATAHGVRDTEEASRQVNRRAIVSFVHGTLTHGAVVRYRADRAHYTADPDQFPI